MTKRTKGIYRKVSGKRGIKGKRSEQGKKEYGRDTPAIPLFSLSKDAKEAARGVGQNKGIAGISLRGPAFFSFKRL